MAKQISGTPFYELKIVNPNAISNYNGGTLVKSIGDDLVKFVGKPMQGLVVKEALAVKIVEKVKKDLVAKKVQEPVLRAGISGKDVVFLVTDAKNTKYEDSCVLVADYVPLREKLKKQAATVVNLDPGDHAVDDGANKLARANGTTAKTSDQVDYGKITGTTSIILLAHGDEDKTATGQIYGKDFAGRTPEQLVAMLLDNPDPKKALSRKYEGTVYLDGCFTAQGSAMQNYTKQVWDLLKRRGLKNVKVKGNLGEVSTTDGGVDIVTPSEAKAEATRLFRKAKADEAKINDKRKQLRDRLWQTSYGTSPDQDSAFFADPELARIDTQANTALSKLVEQYNKDIAALPVDVPDLTGRFGLTRLN